MSEKTMTSHQEDTNGVASHNPPPQGEGGEAHAPSALEKSSSTATEAAEKRTGSTTTTTTTTTVSLKLAKKKKKKKSANHPSAVKNSESVRKALDQEPASTSKDDEFNDDSNNNNKEPLVIPVIANKIRFPTTTATTKTEKEAEAIAEEAPSSSGICQAKGTTAEDEEAIQALQAQSSSSSKSKTDSDARKKISITANANTFNHQERREAQQFKTDLEEFPEQVPLDSEQYQRVPIADFGAALLRGMGWSDGGGNDDHNSNKNNKKDNDDAVMPRPHRLGLGAIPKADTTAQMPPTSGKRRGLRPDQLQQKQRLQQQQDEYQRLREQQVAQDKQRTMQNGSLVLMRVPFSQSSSSSRVKQEPQKQPYRACILQLVGVPGLNMVRVQYEKESTEAIVKRGDIERLLTRDELQQEPFQKAEPTSSSSRDESSRPRQQDDNDRRRQESSRRESSRDDGRRRDRYSEHDDDHYGKRSSSSSKKRPRDNKDDYYSHSDDDNGRRDRKKKRDSDRSSSRRDRDDRRGRGESSDRSSRRRESKEKETFHWATPHIRVRIITEKLGRRYFKEKAVVLDVTHKGLTLQLSSSGSNNGSSVVLDRVPERYLETALPKAGGCVLVLQGDHRGTKGRLLERDSKRAVGILQTAEDLEVLTLPLDDMAEWMGSLDDE